MNKAYIVTTNNMQYKYILSWHKINEGQTQNEGLPVLAVLTVVQ